MKDLQKTCKLALVQAAPIMFDKKACTQKAVQLIEECASNGAEFIVFPELFIPGYPYACLLYTSCSVLVRPSSITSCPISCERWEIAERH